MGKQDSFIKRKQKEPHRVSRLTHLQLTMSTHPPFALDDDCQSVYTTLSRASSSQVECRQGGPKQARMKRQALLTTAKDVDNMFPVKVGNIPRTASHENLFQTFQEFGDIGDVYIPVNLKDGKAAKDFAVIRFMDEKSAAAAVEKANNAKRIEGRPVALSPLTKQKSSFTMGTGYLGLTNEPFDDGMRYKPQTTCDQSISLGSCMSRSGYPWGSVRELKFLAPHSPPSSMDMFTVKVMNLNPCTTAGDLRMEFSQFGEVGDAHCPKPLLVTQQVKEPNCGFGFVRFADKRDVNKAAAAINAGRVIMDGNVLTCEVVMPKYWPTEKTRRYY